jgi:hypothetical protein
VCIVGKALHVDHQPRDVRRHDLRRRKAVTVQRVGEAVGEPEQLRIERVAIHHEVTEGLVGDAGGGVRDVQEERGVEQGIRERGGGEEANRRWQDGARVFPMTYGQQHGPMFVARRRSATGGGILCSQDFTRTDV